MISSCNREELAIPQQAHDQQVSSDIVPKTPGSRTVSKEEIPHVVSSIKSELKRIRRRTSETLLNPDSIYFNSGLMVTAADSLLTVYSFYVGDNIDSTFFNIFIEEDSAGVLSPPLVLMYSMDVDFFPGFISGTKDIGQFSGTITQFSLNTVFGTPGSRIPDPTELEFCLRYVLDGDGIGGGTTVETGPGFQPGNWPGRGISKIGVSAVCFVFTPCPCHPHHLPGQKCSCPTKPTIELDANCNGIADNQELWDPASSSSTGTKNPTYDECYRLLILCGIITNGPPPEIEGPPSPTELLAQALGLGGNQPFIACLDDNRAFWHTVNALVDAQITDPCDPADPSTADIVGDAAMAACASGGDMVEVLNAELGGSVTFAMTIGEYVNNLIDTDPENADDYRAFETTSNQLKCVESDISANRLIELNDLLLNNPNALIEDCLSQNPNIDIQDYQALFNFLMPQVCQDRLDELGNGWTAQPISLGNTKLASLDYYPVQISQRPDINNDGMPDNNEEIFAAIRANFLSLASGGVNNFDPICGFPAVTSDVSWQFMYYDEIDAGYAGNDRVIWPSDNPLAAIFFIEATSSNAAMNLGADQGAVIVSDYCPDECWVFSTITTPESNSQPLSGNRQWGLVDDGSDGLTFYNRASDRARINSTISLLSSLACATEDYYRIGIHTWENLQTNVKNFIEQHGGQAAVNLDENIAINPEYTQLLDMLKSNDPIKSVPCINH